MKTCILLVLLAWSALAGAAATSLNAVNRFAYGANIGWLDCRGDVVNGAVIGQFVCSGYIWSANVGWIHLGSGTAANGIWYQNNSAADSGVNHDGGGTLSGYAYAPNVGWLTFTNRDSSGGSLAGPRVNLLTGNLSGNVYGANIGWISLSNAQAFVQTDTLAPGTDSDTDGLPDAWELARTTPPSLSVLSGSQDSDGDGAEDGEEYRADTNPLAAGENLRITQFSRNPSSGEVTVMWRSRPTRLYGIRWSAAAPSTAWSLDGTPSYVLGNASGITTRTFIPQTPATPNRFFQIEARLPLAP